MKPLSKQGPEAESSTGQNAVPSARATEKPALCAQCHSVVFRKTTKFALAPNRRIIPLHCIAFSAQQFVAYSSSTHTLPSWRLWKAIKVGDGVRRRQPIVRTPRDAISISIDRLSWTTHLGKSRLWTKLGIVPVDCHKPWRRTRL